jgi:hypothetical protein
MIELLSLVGGYVFGFLKLVYLESAKNQRVLMNNIARDREQNIKLLEVEARHDKISTTKRFITVSFVLLFVFIVGIAPVMYPNIPINVLSEVTTGGSWLFGIFDNTNTHMVYKEVKGILFDDTLRNVILAIVGNYFGQRR